MKKTKIEMSEKKYYEHEVKMPRNCHFKQDLV